MAQEDDLQDHDGDAHEQRPGRAQNLVHPQAPAVEDEAAEQRRHQIIGQRHPPEEADVRETAAEVRKAVPEQRHTRHDHQEDGQVEERMQQGVERTERDGAVAHQADKDAGQDKRHGDDQHPAPDLEVVALVIEQA